MLRSNFTWSKWEWDIPESESEDPNLYLGGDSVDGGPVLQGRGRGPKGGVYVNSDWSSSGSIVFACRPRTLFKRS